MKKCRFLIAILLILSLSLSIAAFASPVDGSLDNFVKTTLYSPGQFSDVDEHAWYAENVQAAFELGLLQGRADGSFGVQDSLTIAETLALASRVHTIYYGLDTDFARSGSHWYDVYVAYAQEYGLWQDGDPEEYSADITRAQFAVVFSRTLPASALRPLHSYEEISDVAPDNPDLAAILTLYNAGILQGNDQGQFLPDKLIRRTEAAAILTRLTDETLRIGYTEPEPEISTASSVLEVHFIDVGQADAALLICDGEAMLIDGGNVADSDLIYTYLKNHAIDHLKYIVCTHAHEDHVGGLAGALNYASVDVAYCSSTSYDTRAFESFVKYLAAQGKSITVPSPGDTMSLGSAQITVLGPIQTNVSDINNLSIVLRVVHGDVSFLFTGDAEREEEQDILDAGYPLESTVLKVGHHGSDSSTTYPFLYAVNPSYGVISVGAGNSYGHPTENTLSRLRDADVKVYRTDLQGDIICTSDGQSVTFSVDRNEDIDTLASVGPNSQQAQQDPGSASEPETPADIGNNGQQDPGSASELETPADTGSNGQQGQASTPVADGTTYVLNTHTHKFHTPKCSSVETIAPEHRLDYTGTRDEVIAMGYVPCKKCNP